MAKNPDLLVDEAAAPDPLVDETPEAPAEPTVDPLVDETAKPTVDETPGTPSPVDIARAELAEAARVANEAAARKAEAEATLAELEAGAPVVDPGPHADAVHPPVVYVDTRAAENRIVQVPDFSLAIPDKAIGISSEAINHAAGLLSDAARMAGRIPFHLCDGVMQVSTLLAGLAGNRGFVASYIPTPEGVPADGEITLSTSSEPEA